MDDNFGEWVESMGVASVASGWNLWVWLQCIGVAVMPYFAMICLGNRTFLTVFFFIVIIYYTKYY